MKVISSMIKNELKTRIFSWITPIFFAMLVFQAIWYAKGSFDYYVNDGVLMNAPAIIYRNYATLGMLMVIIIIISTGGVLYKDIQYKTADWLYTYPINEKKFFVARLISAFLYLFIVGLGLFVGTMLLPYSGIGAPNRFGAMPYLQTLHAILIFFIPNIFVYISLIFASLAYTKKMAVGYLTSFSLVMVFIVMQVSFEVDGGNWVHFISDPSGYVPLQAYLDHVTTLQKNTEFVPLSGYLLLNRIIWISISILLFILAYRKFTFKDFITGGKSSNNKKQFNAQQPIKKSTTVINTVQKYTTKEYINKLFRLAKIEFLNIVRPNSFKIILLIISFMVFLQNVMFSANYYIGQEVPLTSNMTFFRLPWGMFIVILLMIWSGELFFKEKTVNIWQITDSLPVPVWVTQIAKLLANFGLSFVLCITFLVVCLLSQLLLGGIHLADFSLYATDLLGFRWGLGNFMLFICLTFFIGGITGNRLITHILSVGYFIFTMISFDMDLQEQSRFGYAMTPGVTEFSELSGYGILEHSAHWFNLMWIALSIAFVLVGIWFWNRGVARSFISKIKSKQLNIFSKALVFVFVAIFFGFQYYLDKQIYATENFETIAQKEAREADYEKKYSYLTALTHPKYQKIDLKVDYYPNERKLLYQAAIELSSKNNIDTLFLNFPDFVTVTKIDVNTKPLKELSNDTNHHLYKYLLPNDIKKDTVFTLFITAKKQYVGLSQDKLQSDITQNGSFATVKDFLPTIGYDFDKELTENRSREDNGLSKLASRMADIKDSKALQEDYLCVDANKVTGKIEISVPKNQTPISAGEFVAKKQVDNRNIHTYKITEPSSFNWCIGAAVYKVFEKHTFNNVNYEIIANPKHPFNIHLYKDAIEKALGFCKKTFSDFNLHNLRFVEISHWNDDFYNFPNTIAISEKQGWVANTSKIKEKAYIYQTVASQIVKQYLQQKMTVANVQGADMLMVGLPEALGLWFVKQELGDEGLNKIKEKKKDIYGKLRNNEPNIEPTLLFADGTEYLEANKGAIQLYNLSKIIGLKRFIDIINTYQNNQPIVFEGLYKELLKYIPNDNLTAVKSAFEQK